VAVRVGFSPARRSVGVALPLRRRREPLRTSFTRRSGLIVPARPATIRRPRPWAVLPWLLVVPLTAFPRLGAPTVAAARFGTRSRTSRSRWPGCLPARPAKRAAVRGWARGPARTIAMWRFHYRTSIASGGEPAQTARLSRVFNRSAAARPQRPGAERPGAGPPRAPNAWPALPDICASRPRREAAALSRAGPTVR
jgi:hypothetical protein